MALNNKEIANIARNRTFARWMGFVGLVLLIIAFWRPVRILIHNYKQFQGYVRPEHVANSFIVLAYRGVEESPSIASGYIAEENFAQHLRLLRENGYHPITLKDLRAFYEEGKLLPPKATLLTFTETKRSTYECVEKYLIKYHWPAVMEVNPSRMRNRRVDSLLWPHLRDMRDKRTWELAVASTDGYASIPTGPNSTAQGNFFTDPMWLPTYNRYETLAEFKKRIEQDHINTIEEFKRELGFSPDAFMFPYGNYGQFLDNSQFIRDINLELVRKYYPLGFELGILGYNMQQSDKRHLARATVSAGLTAYGLVSLLDGTWIPGSPGVKPLSPDNATGFEFIPSQWIPTWGDGLLRENKITLRAKARTLENPLLNSSADTGTGGADAWLAGSDFFANGNFRINIKIIHGQVRLFLRYLGVDDYIALSIDDAGRISVAQHSPRAGERILADDRIELEANLLLSLRIVMRDNYMFVTLGEQMLFGGAIRIESAIPPKAGPIGVSVWDRNIGLAELDIYNARVNTAVDCVITWSSEQLGSNTMKWLGNNVYNYSCLAPAWAVIDADRAVRNLDFNLPALRLFAEKNGMTLMPRIDITSEESFYLFDPAELAKNITDLGCDGIFVNFAGFGGVDDGSLLGQSQMLPRWISELNDAMASRGKRIVANLQIPGGLTYTFGEPKQLSSVVFVSSHDPSVGITRKEDGRNYIDLAEVPELDVTVSTSVFREIVNSKYNSESTSPDAIKAQLEDSGLVKYNAGEYKSAIEDWKKWATIDPASPRPHKNIGNAYLRIANIPGALKAYAKSLELDPGQISLAVEHARLVEQNGDDEASFNELDVYSHAFPGNPQITTAIAGWLDRHKRRDEARLSMRSLAQANPHNAKVFVDLHSYLDSPTERYSNMGRIVKMALDKNGLLSQSFAQSIMESELLALPEAAALMPYIAKTVDESSNEKTRALFRQSLPRTDIIHETFSKTGISSNWVVWGGVKGSREGRGELSSDVATTEAILRLRNSEMIRDGKMEVVLSETVGSFWLYARRSSIAMIRFGYDNDGYLRIQTWRNGRLETSDFVPWIRPAGTLKMSLLVRGDGAFGFVNGMFLFSAPLNVPRNVGFGWWGVAPYTHEPGQARADIAEITAGPLPTAIVLVPQNAMTTDFNLHRTLRPYMEDVSVIAPVCYTQSEDGALPTKSEIEFDPFRMYCALHRKRLMPIMELAYYPMVDVSLIGKIIRDDHLDGLIIRTVSMPTEKWIADLTHEIESTSANVMILQSTEPIWPSTKMSAEDEYIRLFGLLHATLREIPRGSVVIQQQQSDWAVDRLPLQAWAAMSTSERLSGINPRVIVYPVSGLVATGRLDAVNAVASELLEKTKQRENELEKNNEAPPPHQIVEIGALHTNADDDTSILENNEKIQDEFDYLKDGEEELEATPSIEDLPESIKKELEIDAEQGKTDEEIEDLVIPRLPEKPVASELAKPVVKEVLPDVQSVIKESLPVENKTDTLDTFTNEK